MRVRVHVRVRVRERERCRGQPVKEQALTSCEEYLSRENTRRKAMEILRIVSRFLSAKEVLQRVSTSVSLFSYPSSSTHSQWP